MKNHSSSQDPIAAELASIKRLLIFWLLKTGMKQEQVALALGVSQSTISKMFPKGTFDE